MVNKINKIKIAFITTGLYSGGAERNIINLASYFNELEVKSDIILLKKINDYEKEYKETLKKIILINILENKRKISRLLIPFKGLEVIHKLFSIIKKKRYQVLIAAEEFIFLVLIVTIFAKIFFTKSILIIGNNIKEEINTKPNWLRAIYKFLYKTSFLLANRIIFVSHGLAQALIKEFGIQSKKTVVIYNGLDSNKVIKLSKYLLPKQYLRFFKDNDVIITLGRLIYKKGISYLIKAFSRVKQKHTKAKLFIIGKGSLKNYLKKLTKKLKLENEIIFYGMEKENPYKFLKHAKIFVFSSLWEGFGNVIVEAMLCGLPIVSTDCFYGPREILCNSRIDYNNFIKKITYCKFGILVPQLNKVDLGEKHLSTIIIKLLEDKDLLLKYKNMSLLRSKKFSLKKMAESYLKIIKEIVYLKS